MLSSSDLMLLTAKVASSTHSIKQRLVNTGTSLVLPAPCLCTHKGEIVPLFNQLQQVSCGAS